jgi:hypothetical protein
VEGVPDRPLDLSTIDTEAVEQVLSAARRSMMVNLTPLVDGFQSLIGDDEVWESAKLWLLDHAGDQPWPQTMFWWREHILHEYNGNGEWYALAVISDSNIGKEFCVAWADSLDMPILVGANLVANPSHQAMQYRMKVFELFGMATIACQNVRLSDERSAPSWRKESRRREYPLLEWKTVEIPAERIVRPKGNHEPTERESPRLHPVRRHRVRLRSGRDTMRGPFWRGNPSKGIVLHEYIAEKPTS